MENVIINELAACSEANNVRILLAVESGSRAWGLESEDSDYDVRFVYVRPKEDYLRLEDVHEVIDWRMDDELEVVGWDLSKYLRLLRKSNPSTLEWLGFPVYVEDESFGKVRELAEECVSPTALAYHYLGMAKGDGRKHLRHETVSAKDCLVVARGILSCVWAIKFRTTPPADFMELCERLTLPETRKMLSELVEVKKSDRDATVALSDAFLGWSDFYLENLGDAIAKIGPSKAVEWSKVDEVFVSMLSE